MDDIQVTTSLAVPSSELTFRTSRSGGPGGQNVNRRETRVEVVWDVAASEVLSDSQRARLLSRLASRLDSRGRLRIVASGERSQALNRADALERLREVVADALRVRRPRRPTKPSKASGERRLASKRARSAVKRGRERPDVDS